MNPKQRRGSRSPEADRAFARAQSEHQAGRLDDAQELYKRALAIDPDHGDSLHYLGVLNHQTGESERALALITQALMLNDHNADAHHNIGLILGGLGRTDEAIEHYRRALTLRPDYADAHTNLAAELLTKGDSANAVLHFRRALARKPDAPENYGNLAGALIANGQPDEAFGVIGRGFELRAIPQFKELLVDCFKVLKTAPKAAELRRFLGRSTAVASARAALLDLAASTDAVEPSPAALELCCALAQQCFAGHYNQAPTEAETGQIATLRDQAHKALQSGEAIPALTLVALAAYAPLKSLAGSAGLTGRQWPEPLSSLIGPQLA